MRVSEIRVNQIRVNQGLGVVWSKAIETDIISSIVNIKRNQILCFLKKVPDGSSYLQNLLHQVGAQIHRKLEWVLDDLCLHHKKSNQPLCLLIRLYVHVSKALVW